MRKAGIEEFILEDFERERLKGKGYMKFRNPRSTIQSILTSAVPGQVRKTIDRIFSGAVQNFEIFNGCWQESVYL